MTNVISIVQQIIYVLIFAILVTNYVFTAKAIYGIGKKLNLNKTGFTWVPFASSFVLANIADSIDDITESDKKIGRKLRLTTIASVAIMLFTLLVYGFSIANIRHALFIKEVALVFTAFLVMMLLGLVIFITFRYFYTMHSIYKVFKHIESDKAVKYLLISVVLPLGKAFLLRKCRNKFCKEEKDEDTCEIVEEQEK